jgi:hypothetical protein
LTLVNIKRREAQLEVLAKRVVTRVASPTCRTVKGALDGCRQDLSIETTKFVVFYGSIRGSPACIHIKRVGNRVVEGFHRINILQYIIKCVLGDERRVLKREDILSVIPMLVKLGVTVRSCQTHH